MSRVAVIDIGTNSVLLTVVDAAAAPGRPLFERATITRLGEGTDASARLRPAAVDRTLACLRDYAADLTRLGVQTLDVVGTSALRDSGGGDDLCTAAERLLGVRPRVLTGVEEARLAFGGALSGMSIAGPVIVFDLGGGSTEIIQGEPSTARPDARSLDFGSVRLHERHLRTDPPKQEELESLRSDARCALSSLPAPNPRATLVGAAGTVTTLAALKMGLICFDAGAIHGRRLTRDDVEGLAHDLASVDVAARRQLRGLERARADVIVSGAFIALEIMLWSGARELVVSSRGVRWGVLERLISRTAGAAPA